MYISATEISGVFERDWSNWIATLSTWLKVDRFAAKEKIDRPRFSSWIQTLLLPNPTFLIKRKATLHSIMAHHLIIICNPFFILLSFSICFIFKGFFHKQNICKIKLIVYIIHWKDCRSFQRASTGDFERTHRHETFANHDVRFNSKCLVIILLNCMNEAMRGSWSLISRCLLLFRRCRQLDGRSIITRAHRDVLRCGDASIMPARRAFVSICRWLMPPSFLSILIFLINVGLFNTMNPRKFPDSKIIYLRAV